MLDNVGYPNISTTEGTAMPHITIEYSANLGDSHDIDALVDAVHLAALEDGLPALDALRTRAVARHHYRIADGDPTHGFVSIIARIGPGRSAADKHRFMTCLIDTADAQLIGHQNAGSPAHAIAFSAEVQEIDAEFRINRNHVRTKLQGA